MSMDDSDYMGMNTPLEVQATDEVDPNKDVVLEEEASKEQVRLAKAQVRKILKEELKNVDNVFDLPKLPDLTNDSLIARGIETVVRERYAALVTNLLNRFDLGDKE